MAWEQNKSATLHDYQRRLADVLLRIKLASDWDGKSGQFKGVTNDGEVYIVTVTFDAEGLQTRHKQKVGHITTM